MHVFRSMLIDASVDEVWKAVRCFDAVAVWNPGVTTARMESGGPTETGHIRRLDVADGSVFRETLLAHSDVEHFYSYDIVEGPLPVTGYRSTHRFLPITEGDKTLGIWEGWFDCAPEVAAAMEHTVGDLIYVNGMRGLNDYMTGGT